MSIAVIGTGNIGGTLGRAFTRAGLPVRLGSRSPEPGTEEVTIADALAGAETVVLAVPGGTMPEFLAAHAAELDGTLVVDVANRVGEPALNSAADVARLVPSARYARTFNTYAWEVFAEPRVGGDVADLFYTCEEADRQAVEQLITAVGLRPAYLGAGQQDAMDAALRLIFPVMGQYGRHSALRLLTD